MRFIPVLIGVGLICYFLSAVTRQMWLRNAGVAAFSSAVSVLAFGFCGQLVLGFVEKCRASGLNALADKFRLSATWAFLVVLSFAVGGFFFWMTLKIVAETL